MLDAAQLVATRLTAPAKAAAKTEEQQQQLTATRITRTRDHCLEAGILFNNNNRKSNNTKNNRNNRKNKDKNKKKNQKQNQNKKIHCSWFASSGCDSTISRRHLLRRQT